MSCQDNGQFTNPRPAFLQEIQQEKDMENSTNLELVQMNSEKTHKSPVDSPEVGAAIEDEDMVDWDAEDLEGDLSEWDDDETELDDGDEAVLLQEGLESGESEGEEEKWWGRRRRNRRRRTRRRRTRRRCATLTSTTTGYYGCHPVFVPVPCVGNAIVNVLNWLNPFHPAGFNIFAWIQTAEQKTRATARRVIRASHSAKRDDEPLEIGDSIYFGCNEGESVNGHALGARGFAAQLLGD